MADTKITALAAITTVDPAADVLPIVDISDTSMAASGTTKKITTNQILGAGGTATLASATITGDLTVRTNQLVVNSSGSFVGKSAGAVGVDGVQLLASGFSGFSASATTALFLNRNTSDGTVLQLGRSGASAADLGAIAGGGLTVGLGGSEWMRVNSTGLGVGRSPSYKLDVAGVGNFDQLRVSAAAATNVALVNTTSGLTYTVYSANTASNGFNGFGIFDGSSYVMRIDSSGNVGIGGVTPSAWGTGYTAIQNRQTSWFSTSARDLNLGANVYVDAVGYKYIATAAASSYVQYQGAHSWYSATSGTAGTAITDFATAKMTLDASGNLIVNGTTQFAKISSYVTSSGTFQSALGATNGANSDFVVRIKTSVSDVYNSVGSLTLSTGGSGGTERVRIKATGQVRFVPLAADPAGAEAGDVYYNSTSNKLKCYNGTTWNDLF